MGRDLFSAPCAPCARQKDLKDQSQHQVEKTLRDIYTKEGGRLPSSSRSPEGVSLSFKPRLYVGVSLSIPLQGLMDLAKQAQRYGGVLVLRGLVQGSYKKTALALKTFIEQTGTGVLIDPLVFRQYAIRSVPTVVLVSPSGKSFDTVSGFIPVQTALEKMAAEGDLKEDAQKLLQRGNTPS